MQDGPHSAGVREGDILAGKYRVERVLGIGGMGVVVAAHHLQLDEKVALKFLLPDALDNSEAVARFAREARAAVKIKSEHVARVIDVGALPNGAPYMVMEYLDGGDLAAWIEERGALPVEQAVEFVLQACEAIAEAHALGIVHRDLKPANLFCIRRADGRLAIKVLDFGISKRLQFSASAPSAITHASALMGSPLYMSPEQMKSAKTVDSLTDIWALGVILFELVAGKTPFIADSLPELALRVTTEPPTPLREIRPEAPAALESVIQRCLEKDRSKRYRNVAELGRALLPFAPKRANGSVERISDVIEAAGLSSRVGLALPPSRKSMNTLVSAGTLPALGRTTAGSTGRRVAVLSGGVGLALILASMVGLAMWKRGSTRGETSQTVVVPSTSPAVSPQPSGVDSGVPVTPPPPPTAQAAVATTPPGTAAPSALPSPSPATMSPKPATLAPKPALSPVASPRAVPSASSPSVAASKPNANCDPSYYYDAEGNKHFKPECFGH